MHPRPYLNPAASQLLRGWVASPNEPYILTLWQVVPDALVGVTVVRNLICRSTNCILGQRSVFAGNMLPCCSSILTLNMKKEWELRPPRDVLGIQHFRSTQEVCEIIKSKSTPEKKGQGPGYYTSHGFEGP